ncbi:MAG: hypothetical protein ABIG61_15995 [Planctomycetota bacterium]
MPAPRGTQSNAMLYAVITMAFLFIVATALAIFYYIKAEDYRTGAEDLQRQVEEIATTSQIQRIATLVGTKDPRKSRLATVLGYVDELFSTITGDVPEETSAEEKMRQIRSQVEQLLAVLQDSQADYGISAEPNAAALVKISLALKAELDNAVEKQLATAAQLDELQQTFTEISQESFQKEQELMARIEALQREADRVQASYDDLKEAMKQSGDAQVLALTEKLDAAGEDLRNKQKDLIALQTELQSSENRRKYFQKQLEEIKARPDSESPAFKPDGKIISVDTQSGTVYINLGSVDHVYRGLTFAVYNKGIAIPVDGVGKAKIEIEDVDKNVSIGRITQSTRNVPVIPDDTIANLVWDSRQVNNFIVVGAFDVDGDGVNDADAIEKITALIESWGGRVHKSINVNTDFIVLGTPPERLVKPTLEDIEFDPMAMEKYDASAAAQDQYREIVNEAYRLDIPIFNFRRFIDFIGFEAKEFGR